MKSASKKPLPSREQLSDLTHAQLVELRETVKAMRKATPKSVDKSYARRVRILERASRKGAPKAKAVKKAAPKGAKKTPSQEVVQQRKAA